LSEDKLVLKRNALHCWVSKLPGHNWLKIGRTVPECGMGNPINSNEHHVSTERFLHVHLEVAHENLFD